MLSYFYSLTSSANVLKPDDITVSIAESVTAGALANSICSEPGASKYFKGAIVPYTIASKQELLGIDVKYAESNNHANPFTTLEMAKAAVKMFKSRIGISTTGYSLPYKREENNELNQCALDITKPYAYICLYDSLLDKEIIIKEEFDYDIKQSASLQRATVQAKVAIKATQLYKDYVEKIKKHVEKVN
jgi:PncC family amidohydrolase